MIKYSDYFSRKELFYLGVNPNKEVVMSKKNFIGDDKYEQVAQSMLDIYDYLRQSKNENLRGKSLETASDILNNKVERRIVSMFYDLGILEEKDLSRFPVDYKIDKPKRTEICVSEALDEVDEITDEFVENDTVKEKIL